MELLECKNKIKELVFMMANGIGVELTVQFLTLMISILKKHEAEVQ
jgi:hypothetical protein